MKHNFSQKNETREAARKAAYRGVLILARRSK